MAAAGTVAVLLPGAYYSMRETKLPPVEAMRRHGTRIALATDNNPGTSPTTSLLLMLNMGATLFGLTVVEALRGVTVNAAAALRPVRRGRHTRSREGVRPRDLGRHRPRRARLHASASTRFTNASRTDNDHHPGRHDARRLARNL